MNHSRDGFTIIELVIVIAVIAVLAGVTIPAVGSLLSDARISRAKTEVENLYNAIMNLYKDTTYWPRDNDITTTAAWNSARNGLIGPSTTGTSYNYPNWKGPYLNARVTEDPWGNPYYYDGGGRINRTEKQTGATSVLSYGPNGRDDHSRNRTDMQPQGDDIVRYFSQ